MPDMPTDILVALIVALVSPTFLKLVEWIFLKSSEKSRKMEERVTALATRVDELQEKNTQLLIQLGIRDQRINDLEKENEDLRASVNELQGKVLLLEDRRRSRTK